MSAGTGTTILEAPRGLVLTGLAAGLAAVALVAAHLVAAIVVVPALASRKD